MHRKFGLTPKFSLTLINTFSMTLWGRNQFNRDYELGGYGGIECSRMKMGLRWRPFASNLPVKIKEKRLNYWIFN